MRWTSPSGATSYKLQEKSGSGSFGDVYTGSSTSTNITGKAHGTYSYRVHACAGTGNCGGWSSTESVSINNAPVAVDDAAQTPFVTAVEIPVLENDTDADGDDLTVTAVTTPADGTVTITSDADGNDTLVTYTPDSGHPGTDTFEYTVFDGTATDTGTVMVTVNRVKVTPNPSTTGSYTLSWEAKIPTDRYWVLESVPGGESLSSFHSTTSVDYTGKATGEYTYDVFRCQTSPGPGEICEGYGSAKASVILPITPGNLPYRSGVTKGGDAYVNVPIAPVPGVNGLAPRLSIDYSGGRERHRSDQELPADMIGYGWRVGGFSTIRRCVKGTDDSDGISFNDDGRAVPGRRAADEDQSARIRRATWSTARRGRASRRSCRGTACVGRLVRGPFAGRHGARVRPHRRQPAMEAGARGERNRDGRAGGAFSVVDQQADGRVRQRHDLQVLRGRHQAGAASEENRLRRRGRRDDRVRLQAAGRPRLARRWEAIFLGQPQRLTYIHLRLGGSLVRDYRLAYKTERAPAGCA